MIIVDRALEAREREGRPIRVGMIGSGFMAQGLANQIENSVPGMSLVAVYGRKPERAVSVFSYAGHADTPVATDQAGIERAIAERDELGRRGPERATGYTWEAAAEATVRVYEDAAGA